MKKKIAIVGGGAAGVFCAIQIGKNPDVEIHIYEKSHELLKKVKISGGGRCNVTHNYVSSAQFSKNYPRGHKILKQNFDQFSPKDMYDWLEMHGVKLKTEGDGRIFPQSDNSQSIVDCFEKELKRLNINVHFHSEITDIKKQKNHFTLDTQNTIVQTDYLVIATGGAQKERDLMLFQHLSISTIQPVPSLFTFKVQDKALTQLMGLSIPEVSIRIQNEKSEELGTVLITHWGLSGPAILKLSAWAAFALYERNYQFSIAINWMGKFKESEVLIFVENIAQKHLTGKVINYKPDKFPQRFWEYLIQKADIELDKKWGELSKKNKNKLVQTLVHCIYEINGKTTFKEEFVTAGGIDTHALHSHNMESVKTPHLYFIGEVTNIDGITGGFNFQNAWTSATVCARDIIKKIELGQ